MNTNNSELKEAKQSLIKGVIIFIIFGLGYGYYKFIEPKQIRADSSTTTAVLKELGNKAERGLEYPTIFAYQVNGKKYEGHFKTFLPCNVNHNIDEEITNHSYTVVYSNKNPEIARLLISPSMFEEYDMSIDAKSKKIFDKFWDCE